MPFCQHCGSLTGPEALFCSRCGARVAANTGPQTDVAPDRIVQQDIHAAGYVLGGVAADGGISGSFNMTTYNAQNDRFRETEIWRSRTRRLPLGRPGRLAIVIGVLSGLATILSFVSRGLPIIAHQFWLLLLVPLALVTGWFVVWYRLREKGCHAMTPIKGGPARCLEVDQYGRVYWTRLAALCPDCGSLMDLRASDDDHKRPLWICRCARPLHTLTFDHTQIRSLDSDLHTGAGQQPEEMQRAA